MNRRILAATVGAVVVLIAVWYVALYKPTSKRLTAAQAAVATGQAQLHSLTLQALSLTNESKRLPVEERKLAALASSVPSTPAVPQVLDELSSAIASSKVTVSTESQTQPAAATPTSSTGPAKAATTLQTLPMSLTVTGTYAHLMSFLGDLEHMQRSALVQTVQIAVGGTSGLSATIDLDVFYDPTPLPKVPHSA